MYALHSKLSQGLKKPYIFVFNFIIFKVGHTTPCLAISNRLPCKIIIKYTKAIVQHFVYSQYILMESSLAALQNYIQSKVLNSSLPLKQFIFIHYMNSLYIIFVLLSVMRTEIDVRPMENPESGLYATVQSGQIIK